MTQPPPNGPQPPYGQPYGTPQPPYGQQFTPQYGAGYPTPPQRKSNGCLIAGVLVGAFVVLAVAGIIVFFALSGGNEAPSAGGSGNVAESPQSGGEEPQGPDETPSPQGEFVVLPACEEIAPDELDTLMPGYSLEVEDVDTGAQEWWEGYHCSWDNAVTWEEGSYYFLTVVLNDPEEAYDTADDLELYAEDYDTTPVSGLGEGALSWYDSTNEVGCVATYVENLSFSACYDEMSGGEPLPEDEAIAQAEELAHSTLAKIESGDYRE